jgi:hypothetical protein
MCVLVMGATEKLSAVVLLHCRPGCGATYIEIQMIFPLSDFSPPPQAGKLKMNTLSLTWQSHSLSLSLTPGRKRAVK